MKSVFSRTVLLASLGGGLEFYDFVIFTLFAVTIGHDFFPAYSETAQLMGSYSLFAIGYLIRPLGGLIFSHFGDKYGRKKSFSGSISLMAIATLSMACLPSYHQWGLFATVLFTCCRLLQGVAIGGELPGAITFIGEHAGVRKGMATALMLIFLNAGILLAQSTHFALAHTLTLAQFETYGWRIAFAIGGALAIVSYILRSQLEETALFLQLTEKVKVPALHLLTCYPKQVLKGIALTASAASLVSIFLFYLTTYFQTVMGMAAAKASQLALIQLVIFMFTSAFFSFLSDHLSRRGMLLGGAGYALLGSCAFFYGLTTFDSGWALILVVVNTFGFSIYTGVLPCYLGEMFPVNVRYSGVALSYNTGYALFGGISPLASTYLIHYYQSPLAPAWVIGISGVMSLVALLTLKGD